MGEAKLKKNPFKIDVVAEIKFEPGSAPSRSNFYRPAVVANTQKFSNHTNAYIFASIRREFF